MMRGEAREAGNLQRRFLSNHTNSYVSYSHRRDQRPKERGASPATISYDISLPEFGQRAGNPLRRPRWSPAAENRRINSR